MTLGIPKFLKCINKAQPEPCYKKPQLQSRSHFIFTRAPQPCLEWRVTTACELCISVQECYVCEIYMFCTHFTQRYFKSPSRRTLFCDKFAQLHNDEIPRLSHFAIKCRNADQVKCVYATLFAAWVASNLASELRISVHECWLFQLLELLQLIAYNYAPLVSRLILEAVGFIVIMLLKWFFNQNKLKNNQPANLKKNSNSQKNRPKFAGKPQCWQQCRTVHFDILSLRVFFSLQ